MVTLHLTGSLTTCGQHGCDWWSRLSSTLLSGLMTRLHVWLLVVLLGPVDNQMQGEEKCATLCQSNQLSLLAYNGGAHLPGGQHPRGQPLAPSFWFCRKDDAQKSPKLSHSGHNKKKQALDIEDFCDFGTVCDQSNLAQSGTWSPYYWQMNKEETAPWPPCPPKQPWETIKSIVSLPWKPRML